MTTLSWTEYNRKMQEHLASLKTAALDALEDVASESRMGQLRHIVGEYTLSTRPFPGRVGYNEVTERCTWRYFLDHVFREPLKEEEVMALLRWARDGGLILPSHEQRGLYQVAHTRTRVTLAAAWGLH